MPMNSDIKISLIGGDCRQLAVACRLCEEGMNVRVYGIDTTCGERGDSIICSTYKEAVENADVVVLPLPSSTDGVRVSCPTMPDAEQVRLKSLLDAGLYQDKKPLIVGGKLTPSFKEKAKELGFKVIDYYENEILQIKNALPTAEGALEIAMRDLPITIHSCRAAVTGYGRIAKTLSRMLLAMKAHVTVAARKGSDLAYASLDGCETLKISYESGENSLSKLCVGYDVIFNTVPYWIFDRSVLEKMSKSTLLVELASAPGGFDISALNDNGIIVQRAASLPGKCAPISAGRIIGDTILEIMRAEGVI